MLTFLLVLALVCLALFVSLKLAFLIFLGIVAVTVIGVATLIAWSLRADDDGEGHGPMDKLLFGGDE